MSPYPCNIFSCFNYGMQYALQTRWQAAGGFIFVSICSYTYSIIRSAYVHQSRQNGIVQYAQLTRACIVQSAQFPTLQAVSIFLQIRLDGPNYHIFPPCFAQMKWKIDGSSAHKHERTLQFFTFFPAIYSTYNGSARKKSSRIFSCARVRIRFNEFSPSNICLYIIEAAQDRRGGSNRLRAYLAYNRRKLGSNRLRWRDMVIMQSALITCLPYII